MPGLDAIAARQDFDSRWGLAFSPHSSPFNADLIRQARESFYWSDAPILGTPGRIADATRVARKNGVSGFIPSMEAFSYVTQHPEGGEPGQVGIRRQAFARDTLADGRMPYRALLARVQRFAFREFSRDPALDSAQFQRDLGKHIFGDAASARATADLLELQRIFTFESDWYWPSPLLEPEFFLARAKRLNWDLAKRTEYRQNLDRLKTIARKYESSTNSEEREMSRLAQEVVARWGEQAP